ncbi:TldD/PmbA family protein [Hespellia stercorisuis]|uniref:PmbA protein n=1 Tax=Hespellia stercorisuis DSM 15480 TaxID=1121950 RepID=A0A1M6KMN2_9FIRM|nr:metallopeptidase TldD-related protein [Hespellia stercorisuis]SHJ60114.1 PmbA protein [Hespellia stercorisuis DSM 15480]
MTGTFIRRFSKAAYEKGIERLEFYVEKVQQVSVEVYQGTVQSSQLSEVTACLVRGAYHGFAGTVSVESFSESLFEEELETIRELAELSRTEFVASTLVPCQNKKIYTLTEPEELIRKMTESEKKVIGAYPKLKKFGQLVCAEQICTRSILNDEGVCMEDSSRHAVLEVRAEAEKNDVVQTVGSTYYAGEAGQIDMEAILSETAAETCGILGAKPVKTGRYPVILKNKILCEMLSIFTSAFGADNVHKNLSRLAGKKGEQIAAAIVNLIEEPDLAGGINNRTFDDEGTATSKKELVKDGVMQMYLYNQKEARKDGCASTGNGFKLNYKSEPEIYVSNLKLVGEEKTRAELIREMGTGLFITECDGMFAGADAVTGDFSLISKGYRIEGGEIAGGVNQITVAGNFFEMIKEISGISNDYLITGTERGAYVAPSVFVKQLVVSGT